MILQNKVPSRKRVRKKKGAAIPRQRLKAKDEDEVERVRSLQSQIPAPRAKVIEAQVRKERRSRYAAKSGKPAAPVSTEISANFGTPLLANFMPRVAARQGTLVNILIGLAVLTLPKQTNHPLDLL